MSLQRANTAPWGVPTPRQPCGQSLSEKLNPGCPSTSRKASSTLSTPRDWSNFNRYVLSSGVAPAVTTRRSVFGSHAVQCEK